MPNYREFSRYMSGSRLLDSGERIKVKQKQASQIIGRVIFLYLKVRTSMLPSGTTALSVLSIERAMKRDRGDYTCRPASGGQASISLHVLEGNLWHYSH